MSSVARATTSPSSRRARSRSSGVCASASSAAVQWATASCAAWRSRAAAAASSWKCSAREMRAPAREVHRELGGMLAGARRRSRPPRGARWRDAGARDAPPRCPRRAPAGTARAGSGSGRTPIRPAIPRRRRRRSAIPAPRAARTRPRSRSASACRAAATAATANSSPATLAASSTWRTGGARSCMPRPISSCRPAGIRSVAVSIESVDLPLAVAPDEQSTGDEVVHHVDHEQGVALGAFVDARREPLQRGRRRAAEPRARRRPPRRRATAARARSPRTVPSPAARAGCRRSG